MVRDINGLDNLSNAGKTVTQNARKPAPERDSAAETPRGGGNPAGDEVKLSAEALNLQALAEQVNELPEVNVERALAIKAALESGDYQIDDLVVADKLLNSEALFGK